MNRATGWNRRRAPSRARRRAFSLIELSIVVGIVGILALIIVPRFGNTLARQRIDSAGRRVAADLRLARELARTSSAGQIIVFDPNGGVYRLLNYPDVRRRSRHYTVDLLAQPYELSKFEADFGGDQALVFDGYGRPDSGGSVTLQLAGAVVAVSVDGATGEVSGP